MKKLIYLPLLIIIFISACEEKPELGVEGCMDESSCNFNDEADIQLENSCEFAVPGYNCDDEKLGCMDQNACNYDENAQAYDGSCIFPEEGYNCDGQLLGCMDEIACNYNDDAEFDDGTCVYPPPGQDCSGLLYGCTDDAYLEYYTQGFVADIDDGSCQTIAIFGCMDQSFCSYNQFANIDNPSACNGLPGCMDPTTCNYNPLADCPDGSCYGLLGCDDPIATNYNSFATCDDGSCVYDAQTLLNSGVTPSQVINQYNVTLTDLYGCTYQGGIIFHFDLGNNRGLIYSTSEISIYNSNNNVIAFWSSGQCMNQGWGSTSPNIYTGESNTTTIEQNCNEGSMSNPFGGGLFKFSSLASSSTFAGYNDWYLPSIDELQVVYMNLVSTGKYFIGPRLMASSTEDFTYNYAIMTMGTGIDINGTQLTGNVILYGSKNSAYTDVFLTPIRTF
tara:strand:+ start:1580 stop:2920 length:1341 start_codon:yes stop_codon:yes gene_type:complete